MSPEARGYLERALGYMQRLSLNREKLDWEQIRADALSTAAGAQTPSDTHRAIQAALRALGDRHSFFQPAVAAESVLGTRPSVRPEPEGRRIGVDLGYLKIPAFSGPQADEFAERILLQVQTVYSPQTCGWIVDLRGNGGGNMWPMLRGVRPLLGSVTPGYFVSPSGHKTPWRLDTAGVGMYHVAVENAPVAVLHNERTASSGEALVVAFRGRPSARTFGAPTRGLSTANQSIRLADGSLMHLTTSVFADRTGAMYGGEILPDELIEANSSNDAALERAASWLRDQEACMKS